MPLDVPESVTPEAIGRNHSRASLEPGSKYQPNVEVETPSKSKHDTQTNHLNEDRTSSLTTKTSSGPSKSSKPSTSSSNVVESRSRNTTPSPIRKSSLAAPTDRFVDHSANQSIGNEWSKSFVLSLDGGGVRGYSSLLIIKQLMLYIEEIETQHEFRAESSYDPMGNQPVIGKAGTGISSKNPVPAKFLPCHYFDLMAGTSTGGLIAIMLGRLRMSIDDAIEEFTSLAGEVFGSPRYFHIRGPLFWPRSKYDHAVLERVVANLTNEYTGARRFNASGKNFNSDPLMCKTMAVAYEKTSTDKQEEPFIFRSYPNNETQVRNGVLGLRNPGPAHSVNISSIACATSAAPGYFDTVTIDGGIYCDGGFGCNNPSMEAYHEVIFMSPDNSEASLGLILSIGTGEKYFGRISSRSGFRRYIDTLKAALSHASTAHEVHRNMQLIADRSSHFRYQRLNVKEEIGKIKLDHWKPKKHPKSSTEDQIRTATTAYLKETAQEEALQDIARLLVNNRRKRTQTQDRWSDFLGYRYNCDKVSCRTQRTFRMKEFEQHLCEKHPWQQQDEKTVEQRESYDELVDRCRTFE